MAKKTKTEQSETVRGRRRLLQVLSFGGVAAAAKTLPDQWTKPVVDQVLLPAHAQMSPGGGPGGPGADDGPPDILLDDLTTEGPPPQT